MVTDTCEVVGRSARMQWWRESRFGMFVHWGLFSELARHEWAMNRERIPIPEYELLADQWNPRPHAAREWAALAKQAGMKYMVLTTKHSEGLCLWDTQQTDYNAVQRGPKRDLVREYVGACREAGLKVGLYYSLMDWHHPDGHRCRNDEAARRRFMDFTYGCVQELMSQYGQIDILWYDVPVPNGQPEFWESAKMNAMVRELQPQIIINNRSALPEDYGTPEEHITAEGPGRDWEACMTMNTAWGWVDTPEDDWMSARRILGLLCGCTSGQGNLLLNIGPLPDGSVPPQAIKRLTDVGAWLASNGEAIYGKVDRADDRFTSCPVNRPLHGWTRKGNTVYFWVARWPGTQLSLGGMRGELLRATMLHDNSPIAFIQEKDRIIFRDLPATNPDAVTNITVFKLEFAQSPIQQLGAMCDYIEGFEPPSSWQTPYLNVWELSPLQEKAESFALDQVPYVAPAVRDGWQRLTTDFEGFLCAHRFYGPTADGVAYYASRVSVDDAGTWTMSLGYDGGITVFINGECVFSDPVTINPAKPDRGRVDVTLQAGENEILVAQDRDEGRGYGVYCRFEVPEGAREQGQSFALPVLSMGE